MMRLARWTSVLAMAAVLAACGGKSTSTSDGRLGTASYAFTAHDLLGNDFRGNYAWIHGYRSAVVDAKYPCLNEFTDCRALDQQGVTLAVEDLCPTVDTPAGTWTFEFYLSTDAECRQPMPNLVCAIVPAEELKRGANHNEVPCTTDNASKDFDFCIYDPVTGAGSGRCDDVPPPPGDCRTPCSTGT